MKSFFFVRTARDELLHAAFTTELTAAPGTHAEYSDIGFIILGVALERLADEPLDRFSASAKSLDHWRCRIPPSARQRRCGISFRPLRTTVRFESALSKARCRTKTPAFLAASLGTLDSSQLPAILRSLPTLC